MIEREPRVGTDERRAGVIALGTLGAAVLLMVAAGVVGVMIGNRGTTHAAMMAAQPVPAVEAGGFTLDMVPAHMVQHYELARANPKIYSQVPCFCGCDEMLGHRNLEQCFVTPDGDWESHAAGCSICIEESQMLMWMMTRGMSPQMMAERVIAEYGGPMMST